MAEGEIEAELALSKAVASAREGSWSMIVLATTVLLAATGAAVMPCWRHSARWGYGPGVCVGLLLVGIGVFAITGRVGPSDMRADMRGERLAAPAKPILMIEASAVDPVRTKVIVSLE